MRRGCLRSELARAIYDRQRRSDGASSVELPLDEVEAICRTHGVKRLSLFGSAARGEHNPNDLDFLVVLDAPDDPGYADRYFGLKWDLESLFNLPVDLVTERSIRNPYFREEVEEQQQVVFETA